MNKEKCIEILSDLIDYWYIKCWNITERTALQYAKDYLDNSDEDYLDYKYKEGD